VALPDVRIVDFDAAAPATVVGELHAVALL